MKWTNVFYKPRFFGAMAIVIAMIISAGIGYALSTVLGARFGIQEATSTIITMALIVFAVICLVLFIIATASKRVTAFWSKYIPFLR